MQGEKANKITKARTNEADYVRGVQSRTIHSTRFL